MRPPTALREHLHAGDVVLGERILDRHDREPIDPAEQDRTPLLSVEGPVVARQAVRAVGAQLGGGDVERDAHVAPGDEPARSDRLDERLEGFLVAVERRPPSALLGDAGQPAALVEPAAGGPVDLARPVEGFGEGGGAGRHDEEVLHVDAAVGVRAAAEDLDLRHRQRSSRRAAALATAARRVDAAAAWAAAIDVATAAFPPSVAKTAESSRRSMTSSTAAWSAASTPISAGCDQSATLAMARRTSSPPWRSPPSRRSTASPEPVDAPAGASARPSPTVVRTTTSTVGRRPRVPAPMGP